MGFGASKGKKDATPSPKSESKASADSAKPKIPSTPPVDKPPAQATRAQRPSRQQGSASEGSNAASSPSHGSPRDAASPSEGRGFNNPQPARRDTIDQRTNNRQTRMIGAEDMNGEKEELDERPFRQEKVSRVPTKALLKPPKNANSMIADPDDDYDLY